MDKKPTYEDIKNKLDTRKAKFSTLRTEQATDLRYYNGEDKLGINTDAGYHEVRTGTGYDIVEIPARRLLGLPQDTTEPRKQNEKYIRLNTKRKLFLNTFLERQRAEVKEAFKKQLLRGEGYFRVLYDESKWSEEPDKNDKDLYEKWMLDVMDVIPIDFQALDPMNIYPNVELSNGVPRDVIVTYDRTAGEVKTKWPLWDQKDKEDDDEVEWIEYWSPKFRGQWADDRPAYATKKQKTSYKDGVIPNIYGFVPFVRCLSGFGTKDAEGKPEYLARSMLWSVRSLVTAYQRAISFQDSDVALHSHRTGKITIADNSPEMLAMARSEAQKFTSAPGMIRTEVEGGFKIEIDDPPQMNQSLFAHSAHLQGLIEQKTHIAQLAGYSASQVSSGVQQGMSVSWARADYEDAIKNLEMGLGLAMGMVLRLIEKVVEKPVTIRATMTKGDHPTETDVILSPQDIDGFYTVKVKFEADDPTKNDMLSILGLKLRMSGEISQETNLGKYQGFDDPYAEVIKVAVERYIAQNPLLQEAMNQEFMRQWQGAVDNVQQQEQATLASQTPPPVAEMGGGMQIPQALMNQQALRTQRRGVENPELAGGMTNYPREQVTGGLGVSGQ